MTRVNDYIRAPKVRVVYEDQQLGVMSSRDAVAKAKSVGLDLVEVAPDYDPTGSTSTLAAQLLMKL